MKLTELLYPFAFLPVCLLLYYVLPKRCRNAALLAASLLFFAWGTPEYLVLLVLAILLNYFAGLELESLLEDGKTGHARLVLVLTILVDLFPLLFFKYYGEAAAALNRVFVLSLPVHALPAPVGVSFYTFTLLSALSDVYHGRAPMEKNLIRFALFVSFFPKLTSGPIVQYADMQPQLEPHEFVRERVGSGMRLFVIGLAKKVILAGLLGTPFYALKALGPQALSVCGAWLGALLYALMLYFDFSGYSDMAIGAAKMFGFEFLANFDYPYCADSVAAFWRRWHMSLGFWFRTYIYIPLGGSRCGTARTICNLLLVWLLTGIWHGAAATFVVWGLYYGLLLILEKFVLRDALARAGDFAQGLDVFAGRDRLGAVFLRHAGAGRGVAGQDVLCGAGGICGRGGAVLPAHDLAGAADRRVCGAAVRLPVRQPVFPGRAHGVDGLQPVFYRLAAVVHRGHGERDVCFVPLCTVLTGGLDTCFIHRKN